MGTFSSIEWTGWYSRHAKDPAMPPLLVPVSAFAAALAACLYFGLAPTGPDAAAYIAIGGTVASVGATMLGFMLASLAVLASINHTHLVGMMRATGHYRDLLATVLYACVGFLLCTGVGFALVFGHVPGPAFFAFAVSLHIAAGASLLDVGRTFWLVLGHLNAG